MAHGVKIILSSTLRGFVPDYDPHSGLELQVEEPVRVRELCERLGIPWDRVKISMVNGRKVDGDYLVQGGERLALFPAVGGG